MEMAMYSSLSPMTFSFEQFGLFQADPSLKLSLCVVGIPNFGAHTFLVATLS